MYTEQLNNDITQNVLAAHKIRLKVPDTEVLAALTMEEAEEISNSSNWEVTGNISIKKIPGVTISQFAWLDGKLSNNVIAVLNDEMLSGGMGPLLEANLITLWCGRIHLLDDNFRNLAAYILEKEPGFKGFIGMTVTLHDGKPYYRKIHSRVSYDFLLAFGELMGKELDHTIVDDLPEIIKDLKPGPRYACSMRVYSYPYDKEVNLYLEVPEGKPGVDSWIVTGKGEQVNKCWGEALIKVGSLKDVCFRVDGSQVARATINNLKRSKYI